MIAVGILTTEVSFPALFLGEHSCLFCVLSFCGLPLYSPSAISPQTEDQERKGVAVIGNVHNTAWPHMVLSALSILK